MGFKSSLPLFHPYRHVPPTNTNNDINISLVEGYTFSELKSIQNVQVLTVTGGCSRYVCKYIAIIVKQNYVFVSVYGAEKLVTKATFIHNSNITSSKMGEDKNKYKHRKKPQGRCISHMEMLHFMSKNKEVVKDIDLIKVPKIPLDL